MRAPLRALHPSNPIPNDGNGSPRTLTVNCLRCRSTPTYNMIGRAVRPKLKVKNHGFRGFPSPAVGRNQN